MCMACLLCKWWIGKGLVSICKQLMLNWRLHVLDVVTVVVADVLLFDNQ